jgi:hypothetical protein
VIKLVSGQKPDRHVAAFQQLYKWREQALPQEQEAGTVFAKNTLKTEY